MIEFKINKLAVRWAPPSLPVLWLQVKVTDAINDIKKLEGADLKDYVLILKKHKRKSLTANAYMWQLCEKIAVKVNITKEDVYRKAVREVGTFYETTIPTGQAKSFIEAWSANGIGWFGEKFHSTENITILRLYQGSSVYNGEQMKRLIDYVVDEAQNLGIEIMTPNELERLKQLWGGD